MSNGGSFNAVSFLFAGIQNQSCYLHGGVDFGRKTRETQLEIFKILWDFSVQTDEKLEHNWTYWYKAK